MLAATESMIRGSFMMIKPRDDIKHSMSGDLINVQKDQCNAKCINICVRMRSIYSYLYQQKPVLITYTFDEVL